MKYSKELYEYFNDTTILVTGGTGSFGQTFIQTMLDNFKPRRLIVFSRDEYKQFLMQQNYPREKYPCMRYFIGDVRDKDRLVMALRNVDTVVHAAAMKHIVAAEYNPFECIHTNVIGAENLATAAIQNKVRNVIALSTDKAANPVNLYGASKLASDKIFIAANKISAGSARFALVRYGNVIGSRGSVIPYFRKLLKEKSAFLPITDTRMTRFLLTLQQGVDFVLQNLLTMSGGEIFVPKIPSAKIVDIATAMSVTAEHKIIGIRPGEKLHEMLISQDDSRNTLEIDDGYVIFPQSDKWNSDHLLSRGARQVGEDFYYTSDNNSDWLNVQQIRKVVTELGL